MRNIMLEYTGPYRLEPQADELPGLLNPKEMMLYALALCSGIICTRLLNKMRVPFEYFAVDIRGSIAGPEMMPETRFDSFEQIFRLSASDPQIDKMVRAAELTHEKYCGLTAMYSMIAPVRIRIFINGEEFDTRARSIDYPIVATT